LLGLTARREIQQIELRRFVGGLLVPGICNSLSQVVLKITGPGVPDIYQGTELWDLSLVDPDNRRPVDFAARRSLLAALVGRPEADLPRLSTELLRQPADGRVKLLVINRALQHRRNHRALYDRGNYLPLPVEGGRARSVVAFARSLGGATSITLVGRLLASMTSERTLPLGEAWGDTRIVLPASLPQGAYRDVVTGALVEVEPDGRAAANVIHMSRAFAHLSVAVLEPA
jgi:(1->4)-alpha-D-glucan 1-alpha-D-glucosylmutase